MRPTSEFFTVLKEVGSFIVWTCRFLPFSVEGDLSCVPYIELIISSTLN